ncbi:hypothetical protein TNCV_2401421 [Trichonephila clavipes]|nr:hypothetical protein TNCV_2401421 [Trichonephila clavipes]
MNELIDMHEQEQDIKELESLDPVQSENRVTVGNLTEYHRHTTPLPLIRRIGERTIPYFWRTCEQLRHFECDGLWVASFLRDGLWVASSCVTAYGLRHCVLDGLWVASSCVTACGLRHCALDGSVVCFIVSDVLWDASLFETALLVASCV